MLLHVEIASDDSEIEQLKQLEQALLLKKSYNRAAVMRTCYTTNVKMVFSAMTKFNFCVDCD